MGRWAAAAASFLSVGAQAQALSLYTDLRMFNKAQELVTDSAGGLALARRRAEWARHAGSPSAPAMFLACGDVPRAAELLQAAQRPAQLIELSRKLELGSRDALRHVAGALEAVGERAAAAAVYERLADYKKVAELAVAAGDWDRAFSLAEERSEVRRLVYLPYALHCAQRNMFVEAQQAYHMAGETVTAMRVFSILVDNAVLEQRHSDASYLHQLLARRCLAPDNPSHSMSSYQHNLWLAQVYHAYDAVHRCAHEPFSLSAPDSLLNAARYVSSSSY
ncbi:intraflagellar transport protein 122 homolog [Plutella xylostella]|uniref:intraflagellar transport protein 122 homolog n=1 Tax=Plutella xylostella TaxID=51655 RepID=UPI0020324E7F|nr:intraflagellar transport protein 122 homolog [Plutella xylostella]